MSSFLKVVAGDTVPYLKPIYRKWLKVQYKLKIDNIIFSGEF